MVKQYESGDFYFIGFSYRLRCKSTINFNYHQKNLYV